MTQRSKKTTTFYRVCDFRGDGSGRLGCEEAFELWGRGIFYGWWDAREMYVCRTEITPRGDWVNTVIGFFDEPSGKYVGRRVPT